MDIAVTGMACRFPGAGDLRAYWSLLAARRPAPAAPHRGGGASGAADAFDAGVFGLAADAAPALEPPQRLMLELAWTCLEDAGIAPSQLRGPRVGVMIGACGPERIAGPAAAACGTGAAAADIAHCLSRFLGLGRPAAQAAAGCGTLHAIHDAIQALERGDCEMALAGGIDRAPGPADAGACACAEGAGLLLLKPLPRALADGDAIHGVIKGSAAGAAAAAEAIVAAHLRAQVPITSIGHVEWSCDAPAPEQLPGFQALLQAFRTLAQRQGLAQPQSHCGLGVARTGLAGMIKLLLAFRYRRLPAPHGQPLPGMDTRGTPFQLQKDAREWRRGEDQWPRRAGVGGVGAGGTHAHLVLEEAPPMPPAARARAPAPAQLVLLSAGSPDALRRRQCDLLMWLREDAGATPLGDVAATLLNGRDHLRVRHACVAADAEELADALELVLAARATPATAADAAPAATARQQAHAQSLLAELAARPAPAAAARRERLRQLGALYEAGVDLAGATLQAGPSARRVHLPTYPFACEAGPGAGHGAGCGAGQRASGGETLPAPRETAPPRSEAQALAGATSAAGTGATGVPQGAEPGGRDAVRLMEPHAYLANDPSDRPPPSRPGSATPALPLRPAPAPVPASPSASRVPAPSAADAEAVAIIGMAGEFPQAGDLDQFWDQVLAARDGRPPVPPLRGPSAAWRSPQALEPLLPGPWPADAEPMDPQLGVLLRCAGRALADAACPRQALATQRVGVYVGTMNEDHAWVVVEVFQRLGACFGPGAVISGFAHRISSALGLRGPSLTIGAACASSLTALHLARRALLDGECELALAGGVNLGVHAGPVLAPEELPGPGGHAQAADAAARTLGPGEGAGVVVLKRLQRALADGDPIHGVLRASCISPAGHAADPFAPDLRVIEETAARALRESGLPVEDLGYIEAHGQRTRHHGGLLPGDPAELQALANALRRSTAARRFCAMGTHASQGAAEALAGVCSLIKVLLCMRHGKLVPCSGPAGLGAAFDGAALPFHFPREVQPWRPNARGTRVAGIHSFGPGGSSAFVVVESPGVHAPPPAAAPQEPALVLLSARSPAGLRSYLQSVCEHLRRDAGAAAQLADLACASQLDRVAFEHRLAIVAADAGRFLAQATAYLQQGEAAGVHAGCAGDDAWLPGLLSGDAGERFIDALGQAGHWDKLAALWVRGGVIDWPRLHAGAPRRPVAFPPAPLEEEAGGEGQQLVPAAWRVDRLDPPPADGRRPDVEAGWFCRDGELSLPAWGPPPGRPGRRCARDAAFGAGDAAAEDGRDEGARQYWLAHLLDVADTSFLLAPTLLAGPVRAAAPRAGEPVHRVATALDRPLVRALQRCTRLHRVEVQTLVTAAWAILVNRYTRERCAQFGLLHAGAGGAAGPLLPVRVCTGGRERLSRWLPALQQHLDRERGYAHAPVPRSDDGVGMDSLFDSVIVFGPPDPWGPARLPAMACESCASPARVAIELHVAVLRDSVTLELLYKAAREDGDRMATVLEHLTALLEGLAGSPDRCPAALPMRARGDGHERFWKTLNGAGGIR